MYFFKDNLKVNTVPNTPENEMPTSRTGTAKISGKAILQFFAHASLFLYIKAPLGIRFFILKMYILKLLHRKKRSQGSLLREGHTQYKTSDTQNHIMARAFTVQSYAYLLIRNLSPVELNSMALIPK